MPSALLKFHIGINAPPAAVFAYVSDLTKHGEWSANPLKVEAVSNDPIAVGKKYRSTAEVRGLIFNAELRVSEFDPPARFAFDGQDSTGKFSHRFTFTPSHNGTKVVRAIRFTLTLRQWLVFLVLYFPVRRPAANKALHLLKQRLEQAV